MPYKIVFFDIDGTLVDEDKQIPQDTIDALDELKRSGAVAVIATGRAPYFSDRWPNGWVSIPS